MTRTTDHGFDPMVAWAVNSESQQGTHTDSSASESVIEACGLPEIGWRLDSFSIRFDPSIATPYRLAGESVLIHPAAVPNTFSAAMVLRELIELRQLSEGSGTPSWPARILAHVTAAVYAGTVLQAHEEIDSAPAISLSDVIERPAETVRAVAERLRHRDRTPDEPCELELQAALRALPLSLPTEVLLTMGGDDRQLVDWKKGANSYGISPRPTPWKMSFGSCTASSPTHRGFAAAHTLRQRLMTAALEGTIDQACVEEASRIRERILATLGVNDDVQVVLTPSGTDAELVALAISLIAEPQVTSIVVAPNEIGSGSVPAAKGTHFSTNLPMGSTEAVGSPLPGLEQRSITIVEIPVRDSNGTLLDPDSVESLIEDQLTATSGKLLLHVVEGSKTGIRLPRHEFIETMERRFGDRVDVVVDAAQMRIDQRTVVRHLAYQRCVIITGSKFFGGPPFSGAILIPKRMTTRLQQAKSMPFDLSQYLSKADVPSDLEVVRDSVDSPVNPGLLLRWAAALAEMSSFHNTSPEIRDQVLRELAKGIRNILEASPHVEIVESPYSKIPTQDHRGLDDLPTIFTFLARRPDGHLLTMEEARAVHDALGRDVSSLFPSPAPAVTRKRFHLGQPVKMKRHEDNWIGGLRIAVGAPTISRIVFDPNRGDTWTDRVALELADIQAAIEKLALLLDYGLVT